ncbi:hypothetical protein ACFFJX_12195 [Pseudarcicella hirudinis]|nr:hypothetical protein [Pseudarcicella hirudinis]
MPVILRKKDKQFPDAQGDILVQQYVPGVFLRELFHSFKIRESGKI